MDIASLIGMVAGFGLMIFGMVSGEQGFGALGNFFDIPSVIITIGGSICGTMASNTLPDFINGLTSIGLVLKPVSGDVGQTISSIIDLSNVARKEGLLALEDKANNFEDEFLKESILFIVDAIEPDKLKARFQQKLDYIAVRDAEEKRLYDLGAALGPSFGMLGTLVGLINMLKSMNLEGGAGQLGQDMSVALITTFYGSIIANVVFTPLGNKLEDAQSQEMLFKEMIIEGVISIKEGENPKYIEEKLLNFLENGKKDEDSSSGKEE